MVAETKSLPFFGWQVVGAAFVLAMFGWGIGFYGPPIFLGVIVAMRDWPLPVVSAAVTAHFLTGAVVAANLPACHRRIGAEAATKTAALCLSAGAVGWAISAAPWQLFVASVLSGAGWGAMSAAALNGIVSPWFVRRRPAALGMAYNGASVGGVIFSPLWALAIAAFGFANATMLIGLLTVATVWSLARRRFARTPQELGVAPDGDHGAERAVSVRTEPPLAGSPLWCDRRFVTLTAGMALGLFARDRVDGASFFAAGAGFRKPACRTGDGLGNGDGDCRRHFSRLGDAARRRPAPPRVHRLRRAVCGFRRVLFRGRHERAVAAVGHRAVRRRVRQRDVIAAAGRAAGIRGSRCAARGRTDGRHRPGFLFDRAGRFRLIARIRPAGNRRNLARGSPGHVCRCRARAGSGHLCFPVNPAGSNP